MRYFTTEIKFEEEHMAQIASNALHLLKANLDEDEFEDFEEDFNKIIERYEDIIKGLGLTLDMTKAECQLSLGTPNTIQERPTNDGLQEYWFYSDGMYLVFFDGLLKQFRK